MLLLPERVFGTFRAMPRDLSSVVDYLRCPRCGQALHLEVRALRCASRHSFDIARKGYVNFAAALSARSRDRGDSAEMVEARDAFLSRGLFAPVVDAMRDLLRTHLPTELDSGTPRLFVEPGCGTGYYLAEAISSYREAASVPAFGIGLDISRPAVQRAAQRHRELYFFVADTNQTLPLASGVADLLLNVFSPRHPAEFRRIAKPSALLICIIPGPGHLASLRRMLPLIGIEPDKEAKVVDAFAGQASLIDRAEVRFTLDLNWADVRLLVGMTPSSRHLPQLPEMLPAAGEMIAVDADLTLLVFQFAS